MVLESQIIDEIESLLGVRLKDKKLWEFVFVHPSYFHEHRTCVIGDYERLEFLGDSVLGLIVAEFLFATMPDLKEGKLSHHKSNLINTQACAKFAENLSVFDYIKIGKSHPHLSGKMKENTLANFFEAILGAIYLDLGLPAAKDFFKAKCSGIIHEILQAPERNWKAKLQELVQKRWKVVPSYELKERVGPPHEPTFVCSVIVLEEQVGEGRGGSRQEAEQNAAENGYLRIEEGRWPL